MTISVKFLVAQEKLYFDQNGNRTASTNAYYYRYDCKPDTICKAYYFSNDALYFEGIILATDNQSESGNKYKARCTWYYKNGSKRLIANYDDAGLKHGNSISYFENGKVQHEKEFVHGKLSSLWSKEFTDNGKGSMVFSEDFNNNTNDWELYTSDRSSASISDSKLHLSSKVRYGTSRYISVPFDDGSFIVTGVIKNEKLQDNGKGGLIYDFRDWQNHHFFLIAGAYYFIGEVVEGNTKFLADGIFSAAINEQDYNTLKIVNLDGEVTYLINGDVVFKADHHHHYGSMIGFAVGGKSNLLADRLEIRIPLEKENKISADDKDVKGSGSGLILSADGLVVTNYHVVAGAKNFLVELSENGISKNFEVKLIARDEANDLALLKISDTSFHMHGGINYKLKNGGTPDIGSYAFTIGYPLALSGMGKEPKFSDGRISAKTGYNNEANTFQTTIPVQPGSSGSPVFNDKGELIGIVNSKVMNADNVSYAIKPVYLNSLLEAANQAVVSGTAEDISGMKLEEQIRRLLNVVVLVKVKN